MTDYTAPQKPKGFSRTLILLIGLVVVGAVGLTVVLGLQDGGGEEKTNTVVTNGQTNTSSNVNSAVNTNTAVDASNSNQIQKSNSEKETATYTNPIWGYSFQYPANLRVQDYTSLNSRSYNGKLLSDILVPIVEGNPYIQVNMVDDVQSSVQRYLEERENIQFRETTTIDGVTFQYARGSFGADSEIGYYVGTLAKKTIVISCFDSCPEVIPTFTMP